MKQKRFFTFYADDNTQIDALIVTSRQAKAKFILHVQEQTEGDSIFRVIKWLDRKINRTQRRRENFGHSQKRNCKG